MTESAEQSTDLAVTGWHLGARLVLFGILGAVTGGLSGWYFQQAMDAGYGSDFLENGPLWVPGTIYGLLWLVVAWIGKPMAVREKCRRSWLWTIGFLVGVTISYTAAYHSANHVASFLTQDHKTDLTLEKMMLSGFLGGIPGGLGLVCMLGLMFRGFDGWGTRSALTACSALLGVSLALWQVDDFFSLDSEGTDEKEFGIVGFFIIWQSGMAVAIVALDGVWQSKQTDSKQTDS